VEIGVKVKLPGFKPEFTQAPLVAKWEGSDFTANAVLSAVVDPVRPLRTTVVFTILLNVGAHEVKSGTELLNITVKVLRPHGYAVLCDVVVNKVVDLIFSGSASPEFTGRELSEVLNVEVSPNFAVLRSPLKTPAWP